MKHFILATFLLFTAPLTFASQIINLTWDQVQAAQFISKCSAFLGDTSDTVTFGQKGLFEEGIFYSFSIKPQQGQEFTLEIRWDKKTRNYKCEKL